MKSVFVTVLSVLLLFSAKVYADDSVTVTVDGEKVHFSDAEPVIVNDRTYVPVRAVFEGLGAYVEWDNETRCVYASKRFLKIVMPVDEKVYYVNSDKHTMVSEPLVIDDRLMIPVRDVSISLSAEIEWDAAEKNVIIKSPKEAYDVEDLYLEFWKKHDDSVVLMGMAAYPHINDEENVLSAFNEFVLGESEAYADKISLEYFDKAVNDFKDSDGNGAFVPYMFERRFDITYDKNSMISILFNEEIHANGILPQVYYEAMTYDTDSGKLLDVWDVLPLSEAEIRKAFRNKLVTMVKENADEFYFDAMEIIENGIGKMNWYINDEGVHFFVNPGILAPISYGVVEFEI